MIDFNISWRRFEELFEIDSNISCLDDILNKLEVLKDEKMEQEQLLEEKKCKLNEKA